jgi:hypothetical protein
MIRFLLIITGFTLIGLAIRQMVLAPDGDECVLTRNRMGLSGQIVIIRDHDQLHCLHTITDDSIIYVCPRTEP